MVSRNGRGIARRGRALPLRAGCLTRPMSSLRAPRENGDHEVLVRHQVVFSHSLNARGRSIASGETEVVSPAKHKRDNAEAIFS